MIDRVFPQVEAGDCERALEAANDGVGDGCDGSIGTDIAGVVRLRGVWEDERFDPDWVDTKLCRTGVDGTRPYTRQRTGCLGILGLKTWTIGPVSGDEGQLWAAQGKPAFGVSADGAVERTHSTDEGKILICRLGTNGNAGLKLNEGEPYSNCNRSRVDAVEIFFVDRDIEKRPGCLGPIVLGNAPPFRAPVQTILRLDGHLNCLVLYRGVGGDAGDGEREVEIDSRSLMVGVDRTLTIGFGIEVELDGWLFSCRERRINMAGYGLNWPRKAAGDGEKWQTEKYPT